MELAMELAPLDYVIIAILLISASLSLIRGFTKEVLSIAGWVISGYAAIFFGPSLKPVLANYIKIDWVVNGGAMLLVFLLTLIIFSIIGSMITGQLKGSALSPLDRTMGVLFGAARGAFIVCIAYLGVSTVLPENDHPEFITAAQLRPMLQTGSKAIVAFVPLDRLPLNLANIGSTLNDTLNEQGTKTLHKAGENILRDTVQQTLDNLGQETQDSDPDTGYKQVERNQMERLIRNTEGVEK